ncbi:unnamed protein product [Symbiodinium natans]|uniref:Uncharacterized protein n=1 Tax=Symbiodinium natans TaxID=878477 RepID=A0A812K2W0_9DINO|nr:unnamed protein product [Symbiodinium natans]
MFPLFALLLLASVSSHRVRDSEEARLSVASVTDQNVSAKAKKGQPCSCYEEQFRVLKEESTCCNEGLVCDVKSHTCKAALGKRCDWHLVGTECASSATYAASTECFAHRCCLKSGEHVLQHLDPATGNLTYHSRRDCCTGSMWLRMYNTRPKQMEAIFGDKPYWVCM